MAINKVVYGGNTLIDLSGDTVTPETLAEGVTAHNAAGVKITGTAESGGGGGLPDTIVAGDTPVIIASKIMFKPQNTSTLTATGLTLAIPIAGTYRIKWGMGLDQDEGTISSQIYQNGIAVGSQVSVSGGDVGDFSLDLACAAGDTIEIYALAGSYWGYACGGVGGLCACIDWDNGF